MTELNEVRSVRVRGRVRNFESCTRVNVASAEVADERCRAPTSRDENLSHRAAAPEHLRGTAAPKRVPRVPGQIELEAKVLEASKRRARPSGPEDRSSPRAARPEMLLAERREGASTAEPTASTNAATSN